MTFQIVYDADWATVRYHAEDGYIYHTFHSAMHGQYFRETMNAGLDALAQNRAIKWLSDDRKNAAFEPGDIEFALADWGPRAAQSGWKFWALVVPESIAGRDAMIDIVDAFHKMGVRVAVFSDLEAGRNWLLKQ